MDAKNKTRGKSVTKKGKQTASAAGALDDLAIRQSALLDAVLTADSVAKFVTALNQTLSADDLTLVRRQKTADGETVESPLDEWAPTSIAVVDIDTVNLAPGPDGSVRVGVCPDGTEVMLRPLVEDRDGLSCSIAAGLVVRTLKLHRTLVGSQIRSQATSIVLDAVPLGVILVNAAGRVLQTNRAAQRILALTDGLSTDSDGALLAAARKDTERLHEVVSEVASAAPGGTAQPVGVLKLDRPTMSGSWLLAVIPVHARRRADTVSEIAAIFVTETDTGDPTGIPPQSIERLFALTPAEARLLVALVDGLSLDEIAARSEVSKNTLRNQLNQIFRKTGANKQSELVRMVLASPAAMLHRARYRTPDGDPETDRDR